VGVDTSAPFHLRVMDEPDFRAGRLDIRYLERHEETLLGPRHDEETLRAVALAAALLEDEARTTRRGARMGSPTAGRGGWSGRSGWKGR
jgi:acetyl/propionyl-CoA carboxylase alpha subunit